MHSDFITRRWLENLISAILYTFFGVWPRDHYMPLRRLTPAHMPCLAIGFPLLGTTEYPQVPFVTAKVSPSWVQQNTLMAPLAPCGLIGIAIPVPHFRQDILTRAFLISQQTVPYRTRGGTCYRGVSTPKIQSLVDSSMTSHISWQNPTISTIPTLLKSQHRSSPRSSHITRDGRLNTLTKTQAKLNII
jgi:hypothetical protein